MRVSFSCLRRDRVRNRIPHAAPVPLACILSLSMLVPAAGQAPAPVLAADLVSFEQVWTTIRDTHWQENPAGLDWQAIYDEYRPRAERAATRDELRQVIREMLGRLHQTHFAIFPATVYSSLAAGASGPAVTGIDLRVLDGKAVVTGVAPGSPAATAGVKPGWIVESVGRGRARSQPLAGLIEEARANPELNELQLVRSLEARLSGPLGGSVQVTFRNAGDIQLTLTLGLGQPRGEPAGFGNLPPTPVFYEEKRFGPAEAPVAYVHFNAFLDIPRIMRRFEDTLKSCDACSGLILDLRGNPGGVGGMAMGMAGFLVSKRNQRLGTMQMRGSALNFVINPRPKVFSGPVAVLVDETSASTAEILAGGLQDLGRARVFGTRTAAAALPSLFERLPNGDGFQYAIANYISEGGQALEGNGVIPDQEVRLTRETLLAGRDTVVDAAVEWIQSAAPDPGAGSASGNPGTQ